MAFNNYDESLVTSLVRGDVSTTVSGFTIASGVVASFDAVAYMSTDQGIWEFQSLDAGFYVTNTQSSAANTAANTIAQETMSGIIASGQYCEPVTIHKLVGQPGNRWFNIKSRGNAANEVRVKFVGAK